jgi:hypothetical protein
MSVDPSHLTPPPAFPGLTRNLLACMQHCGGSNCFPVPVPVGAAATLPVLLVNAHGEPLRVAVTSKEATGSPRAGLLCLIAVACGADGSPLEGVSAGVSDAFQVPHTLGGSQSVSQSASSITSPAVLSGDVVSSTGASACVPDKRTIC